MDKQSIIAVAKDIKYLSSWGDDISADEVRRGSVLLRRLLVENAYGNAWRAIKYEKQPQVMASDLNYHIGKSKPEDFEHCMAGGALWRGHTWEGMTQKRREFNIEPLINPETGLPVTPKKVYYLSEYISVPCGIYRGVKFNRREVIQYVAYVMDGVHSSKTFSKDTNNLLKKMGGLEKEYEFFEVGVPDTEINSVFMELLAIGQTVGKSADGIKFSEHVLQQFPETYFGPKII